MKRLLLISAIGLIALPAAGHDRYRREHHRELRCKDIPIHAVGDADHLKDAAKNSAIRAFQAQVVNLFGEQWMDYESARVIDEHFDLAGLGRDVITNEKRYVITAYPCLRRREFDDRDRETLK